MNWFLKHYTIIMILAVMAIMVLIIYGLISDNGFSSKAIK